MKLRVARKVEKRVHRELAALGDVLEHMMAVRSPLELIRTGYKLSTWNKACSRTWRDHCEDLTAVLSAARTPVARVNDLEQLAQQLETSP